MQMDKPTVIIYRSEGQSKGRMTDLDLYIMIPKLEAYTGCPGACHTLPDRPEADASIAQRTQIFFNPAKNTRYFA